MNRLPVVIAITGTVLSSSMTLASMALAADPAHSSWAAHSSWSAKRQFASQVIDCMRRRMANDKYISYNQAAKICKDEVTRQTEGTDTGPLVAADTKH